MCGRIGSLPKRTRPGRARGVRGGFRMMLTDDRGPYLVPGAACTRQVAHPLPCLVMSHTTAVDHCAGGCSRHGRDLGWPGCRCPCPTAPVPLLQNVGWPQQPLQNLTRASLGAVSQVSLPNSCCAPAAECGVAAAAPAPPTQWLQLAKRIHAALRAATPPGHTFCGSSSGRPGPVQHPAARAWQPGGAL